MKEAYATSSALRSVALGVCAFVGLGIALFDIFSLRPDFITGDDKLHPEIIARVGTSDITWRRYREVLSDMEADRRARLTEHDRAFALQRLIDEQLLIDRAIEMNLDASVPDVRKSLASALLAHVSAQANAVVASDDELRTLYREEKAFFSQPARYGIAWYQLVGTDAQHRSDVEKQLTHLRMGTTENSAKAGFSVVSTLPARPMPASTLANYVGGTLSSVVADLPLGEYSTPLYMNGAWHVVFLKEKLPAQVESFAELKPVVEAEFMRRNADSALQDYLKWLADRTHIVVDPEFE